MYTEKKSTKSSSQGTTHSMHKNKAEIGSMPEKRMEVDMSTGDSDIVRKVKSAFSEATDLSVTDLKITSHNGEVTVNGLVEKQMDIHRASAITEKVKGVKSVVMKLTMHGASERSDEIESTSKVKKEPEEGKTMKSKHESSTSRS